MPRTLSNVLVVPAVGMLAALGAYAQEVVISKTYVRAQGQPVTVTDSFTVCDPAGQFTLRVDNGPAGEPKVSSGTVTVNSLEVVHDADFNQQIAQIERPLTNVAASNALEVRLGSQVGGTIAVSILGVQSCGVRITTPVEGTILRQPETLVDGEVTTAGATGVTLKITVTVQGQPIEVFAPAAFSGNRFAAWVPLAPGTVQILARADGPAGEIGQDSVSVSVQPDPPEYDRPIPPDVSPTVGFAPLAVTFGGAPAADPTVTVVDLDVNGDGTVDYDRASFATPPHRVTHTYQTEGLYVAAMLVRDQAGQSRTTKVPIHVIAPPNLALIWDAFRAALGVGDVDTALGYVALEARERYRRVLEDLRADLPSFATALGALTPHVVTAAYATASTARTVNGVTEAFVISFVRDGDGVWRIASL